MGRGRAVLGGARVPSGPPWGPGAVGAMGAAAAAKGPGHLSVLTRRAALRDEAAGCWRLGAGAGAAAGEGWI